MAALFFGLSDDSRTKRKISGHKLTFEQTMLATIVDGINLIIWMKTQDGAKGRNKPKSILSSLLDEKEPKEYLSFSTTEELDRYLDSFGKGE